ncbi:MAG: hypothetical protein H0V29_09200 [Thermoleophilaceae bacterium]|nr:hypothetical protein [Thermoleophilaceae bacterium]
MAVANALYQWEDGQRRLVNAPDPDRLAYEHASDRVLEELRRRLGSTFSLQELADFYESGTDWATGMAHSWIVDASFARYAREASDFGGGRQRA